ncbi:hypothetical protein N9459_02395 [Flavobacteriaceae bacterium]|nr:hypothetical protein [Flavobacteriaceae bacterium]
MKEDFINKEIWMLTFGASFQRAYAYVDNASNDTKIRFKNYTTVVVENILAQYKTDKVTDVQHIDNIKALSVSSKQFSEIFNGGKINFGIAQKMLNLYLKYQWCLCNINEPPHFPVDRIIQQKLNEQAKLKGLPKLELLPWTQFKDETHYIKVINHARALKITTPAKLELKLFQRR